MARQTEEQVDTAAGEWGSNSAREEGGTGII